MENNRLEILLCNAIDLLITAGYTIDEIVKELGMTEEEGVKYLIQYDIK